MSTNTLNPTMTEASRLHQVKMFWEEYQLSLPGVHEAVGAETPGAWAFGEGQEMADRLGSLVLKGIKTATCSLIWEYEFDNDPLPQKGELSIILDGQGSPICIIQTVDVEVKPFNEVGEQFAFQEGEGDRSLAYWRREHWDFFSNTCKRIGRKVDESMPLVCERFQVTWRPAPINRA